MGYTDLLPQLEIALVIFQPFTKTEYVELSLDVPKLEGKIGKPKYRALTHRSTDKPTAGHTLGGFFLDKYSNNGSGAGNILN